MKFVRRDLSTCELVIDEMPLDITCYGDEIVRHNTDEHPITPLPSMLPVEESPIQSERPFPLEVWLL